MRLLGTMLALGGSGVVTPMETSTLLAGFYLVILSDSGLLFKVLFLAIAFCPTYERNAVALCCQSFQKRNALWDGLHVSSQRFKAFDKLLSDFAHGSLACKRLKLLAGLDACSGLLFVYPTPHSMASRYGVVMGLANRPSGLPSLQLAGHAIATSFRAATVSSRGDGIEPSSAAHGCVVYWVGSDLFKRIADCHGAHSIVR